MTPLAALLALSSAAAYTATPSNFQTYLGLLQPGDTLTLQAGNYPHFSISGLNGNAGAWITITGPESGSPAVVQADSVPCCNTIEISSSSYVAIRHLTVDNLGVDGAFAISAASGVVHHIRVEYNRLVFTSAGQQTDGISTKTPTWGWEIRGNHIEQAGTGLYLGNSNGTDPFVDGIIENNLVMNTVGYNMEIKYQLAWPTGTGLPTQATRTVIRHNVFIKDDRPSPDGDRPNLLVDGFPDTGPGSDNFYEIYGNLFFENPREALLQVSGKVSIHDNLFIKSTGPAMVLTTHDGKVLKHAYVYNNTVVTPGTGIGFATSATIDDLVTGNLVYGASPITGTIAHSLDNRVGPLSQAAQDVRAPVVMLPGLDLYPLPGRVQGTALDLTKVMGDVAPLLDFNSRPKGGLTFRGAYAGEGTNPGWAPNAEPQPTADGGSTGGGAGGGNGTGGGAAGGSAGGSGTAGGTGDSTGGGTAQAAGGGSGTAGGGGGGAMGDASGCHCDAMSGVLMLAALVPLVRRRRRA